MIRKPSDIVMALDNSRIAKAALDNVGIYRALNEIVNLAYLLGFRLEDPDKLLADYLALGFGLCYTL